MEKFNTWADAYTGVQPFLPLPSNLGELGFPAILAYWVKWLVIQPAVAIIRLPLIFFILLLLWLVDMMSALIPAAQFRRLFVRAEHLVLGRLLLFLLGFYSLDSLYMPSKRGNKTPSTNPGDSAASGHIVLANHNSYVDLIFLLYQYSPVFTTLPNEWNGDDFPKGVVIPRSFFGALKDIIYQPRLTKDQVMEDAKRNLSGPVVVFPEATTTNGKVLLGVVPALTTQNILKASDVHVVALKYSHTEFSPVYTCGSFVWHFLRLASQISNDLSVRFVIDADIPVIAESDDAKIKEEWIDNLYTLLSTAMMKRRAKITVKEKFPFLQYYKEHYSRYRK